MGHEYFSCIVLHSVKHCLMAVPKFSGGYPCGLQKDFFETHVTTQGLYQLDIAFHLRNRTILIKFFFYFLFTFFWILDSLFALQDILWNKILIELFDDFVYAFVMEFLANGCECILYFLDNIGDTLLRGHDSFLRLFLGYFLRIFFSAISWILNSFIKRLIGFYDES
jgi:hypothetical protein